MPDRPIIALFPGQGSQKPGMGKELAAAYPAARDVFAQVDDALGVSLSTLCFEGPAEELTRTDNAQPALFAHGAAAWAVVRDAIGHRVVAAAGHSLGELTAYHAAGALDVPHGARLVRRRGELMYQVGTERPGTMAAILGTMAPDVVEAMCAQATSEAGEVVPANYNSDHQTVVSGEVSGVERVMELAKAAGAKRVVKLAVSGAFHSPLMAPAQAPFGDAIVAAALHTPSFPVYANVTAQPITSANVAGDLLRQQLTAPVRWTQVVHALADAYPDALYVELGPGNVLSGLVSRILHGAHVVSCGTPADVESLLNAVPA